MKRIKAACICQTLHFMQKEDVEPTLAAQRVRQEAAEYKQSLERNRTHFKILEETTEPDGSVTIQLIKQYNQSPVGAYFD